MKKRVLSLALCLVLVVGLFSGLTVNASAGRLDDLKKAYIKEEKLEQIKEEFEIPDLDTEAILNSFMTAATSGDFGENNCLHWEVKGSLLGEQTLTISGTGAMPDFDFPKGNLAPWWNYKALGMIKAGIGGLNLNDIKIDPIGNLTKVVIKDGVTNVGSYALFFLPAATQVTMPESVTSIGRYGIAMCSKLTDMSIPKGVTEIDDFGLAGDGLTAVTLPDGLQSLGRGAFDACTSLTNTTLPAAITAVPGKCFANCTKLLNVKYAGTVTAIGDLAFESCRALTAAPIPETVTEIGASAFTGCTALTDVTIPAGVTAIPEDCFRGCIALKDMKLPGTVTSVGLNAFTGCTALKDVRCYGAPPTVEPGNSEAHSFEPAIVTIHYNPAMNWTLEADGTWQGYKVSSKGACLHTGYGTTENTVPATCGEAGRVDTICSNCGEIVSTKEIPATGAHTWDNGTVTTEPTENEPGVRTFTCAVCGATKTAPIPATGTHDYQFTKTVAPTCTAGGYDLYTCSGCGATEKRNPTDALGHKWDNGTVTTEPTETAPGVRTYTCTICGEVKTEVIPATGAHTHKWDAGTVTTEPTETTPGVRTYTCTICGLTKEEVIPPTGGSGVCPGGPSCPSYGFSDVAGPSDWSHEGIDYCVRRSLMVGTGAGTFSPGMNCSRAQIVQILYNLSGDKTDYSRYYLPFTDVAPGAWYYDAVAWAYDNDVVSGTSESTFAPNDVITREQMAVILYGYTAEFAPEFTGNAASLNTFPDAGSVANWAYAAMSWAVGNGLISGMGSGGVSYLAPQGSATRAQASAIIMRYCQLIGQ
ncbi:MAG: leucine-rich repeat protein [Clostridiales bacterium]|nr:leucine-rich repeat protein [Clostridiales bacterium]